MHESTDVLVHGAGPVGLFMAAELRRHDVACRIIDKLAEPMSWVKALGVSQRTLEIWDDLGIVTEALDAGLTLRRQRVFVNRQEVQDADVAFPTRPLLSTLSCCPQPETERLPPHAPRSTRSAGRARRRAKFVATGRRGRAGGVCQVRR